MPINGQITLANSAALAASLLPAGIVTQAGNAGDSLKTITQGLVDPAVKTLGAGIACSVGLDTNGNPVRVTDVTCVSGNKYLGSCDVNGSIYVNPSANTVFDVRAYGAVLDDSTDDTTAINAAIHAAGLVDGGIVAFPYGATAKVSSTLHIDAHSVTIRGNNATIDFTGTSGSAIDATLIGVSPPTYPNNVTINDLQIVMNGNGATTGVRVRFTHSDLRNVQIALKHASQTGFELPGDTNGTGPYYNRFYGCNVQGTSVLSQTGWNFTHDAGTPTRCPNANRFFGGRVGQVGLGWHIEGACNVLFSPTVEGTVDSGTSFDINHASSAVGCQNNRIDSPYIEQNAETGTTIFKFGSNADGCALLFYFATGVSPGTLVSDSGTNTVIVTEGLTQFQGDGFVIQQPNPVKHAIIRGATPQLALHETSNDYEITFANEGGADAGNNAFTIRDNITADRLVAAIGTVAASLRAASLVLDEAGNSIGLYTGSSNPNSNVHANVGSIYIANSGAAGTVLWLKESGAGTNTGWVAYGILQRGTVVANGATGVDVTCTPITANSVVVLTRQTDGGTPGNTPRVTISAGSKFTINGDALDTSTYAYAVFS